MRNVIVGTIIGAFLVLALHDWLAGHWRLAGASFLLAIVNGLLLGV